MLKPRTRYSLLLHALLPYALGHLAWRARRQPEYLQHVPERFGRYRHTPDRPVIWVHAVSVGETRAAAPLVAKLRQTYPDHDILMTHMTPTGRQTGVDLFGDQVKRSYLPYDLPFTVKRFLDHFRPRLGLILETEIWCNLIHACHARGIPLLLVNARLSEKSAAKYRRHPALIAEALRKLAGVAAQTRADAERLESLGARDVQVTGNIKFDITPPESLLALGAALRQRIGLTRPVFLAASTRDGEETLLLDALCELGVPQLLTIIVPRHPQRFGEVAALLAGRGLRFQRRSENDAVSPATSVLLGDSMGEMFAYYAACDLAFIGGSLLPYGAQNLIEACAVGKPVLIGPHTFNFAEATELAIAAGAAIQVQDAESLARATDRLLKNPAAINEMGERALAFSRAHQGATHRIMSLIRVCLPLPQGEGRGESEFPLPEGEGRGEGGVPSNPPPS